MTKSEIVSLIRDCGLRRENLLRGPAAVFANGRSFTLALQEHSTVKVRSHGRVPLSISADTIWPDPDCKSD